MPPRSNRSVHVRGNVITIYKRYGSKDIVDTRMVVDADWVRLWYTLREHEWDDNIWNRLGDKERLFMVRAARSTDIKSKDLEIAHASDQKREMDRLATLEGEMHAGNLSHRIADEYNDIIDQLAYTYDLDPRYTSHLKRRMANSLASLKK